MTWPLGCECGVADTPLKCHVQALHPGSYGHHPVTEGVFWEDQDPLLQPTGEELPRSSLATPALCSECFARNECPAPRPPAPALSCLLRMKASPQDSRSLPPLHPPHLPLLETVCLFGTATHFGVGVPSSISQVPGWPQRPRSGGRHVQTRSGRWVSGKATVFLIL